MRTAALSIQRRTRTDYGKSVCVLRAVPCRCYIRIQTCSVACYASLLAGRIGFDVPRGPYLRTEPPYLVSEPERVIPQDGVIFRVRCELPAPARIERTRLVSSEIVRFILLKEGAICALLISGSPVRKAFHG